MNHSKRDFRKLDLKKKKQKLLSVSRLKNRIHVNNLLPQIIKQITGKDLWKVLLWKLWRGIWGHDFLLSLLRERLSLALKLLFEGCRLSGKQNVLKEAISMGLIIMSDLRSKDLGVRGPLILKIHTHTKGLSDNLNEAVTAFRTC